MSKFIQEHRINGVNEAVESADEVTRLKIELDVANARIKELEEGKKKKKKKKKSVQPDVTVRRILHVGPVSEVSSEALNFGTFLLNHLVYDVSAKASNEKKKKKKAKKKPVPTND